MTEIRLMNPNSAPEVTASMCEIAARALPVAPIGWTAPAGPPLIVTPEALARAAEGIAAAEVPGRPDAVIVAAFGDPGAEALAARLACPVLGIGAAAARAAARSGLPFAVATTTPGLEAQIDALMRRHADGAPYLGCRFAAGDPVALMRSEAALDAGLLAAIAEAQVAGAAQVVIGGGPLGAAAERLRDRSPVPLLNPVLCAAEEVAALFEVQHV
ncbi:MULTISPECIES: aspartate/glutamate racemase family protein [Rhodovulum]|nr:MULTISPECIES: aspartate/glutamate racemase family protein [Rhodovulum]